MKWFTTTYYASGISDIDVNNLKAQGIKVIMLDIDNTLVPTSKKTPTPSVVDWIENAKSAGMHVVLFSNNSEKRVSLFNKNLKLYSVHRAFKPLGFRINKIAREYKVRKSEICMIGDQVFTDVWGANRAGVMSVLVMPLSRDEGLGVRLKRHLENIAIKKYRANTYCLIGNPVAHSKSPRLHEMVYESFGIKARYMLCRAEKENLGRVLSRFKYSGVQGFNVTVPFKQDIIPYLDKVDEEARVIGSVNTVVSENGKWVGYNTDGKGFIRQLKANNTVIKGSRVKIIGAGGTTAAIAYALSAEGAKSIEIYNRTFSKAEALANRIKNVIPKNLADFTAADCDILINATSVGMSPDVNASPVDNLCGIEAGTCVYDIIYNPPVTKFMEMAISKGCKAYNGLALLVYQGVIADEIWFGRQMADEQLIKKIIKRLGEEI